MKKLLLLTGLLVISSSIFAAAFQSESEAEVKVNAEVLSDLSVTKNKDVDFGILKRGSNKEAPDTPGEFQIKGSDGTKITISVKDANSIGSANVFKNIGNDPITVVLKLNGEDPTGDYKDLKIMTSKLRIYDSNENMLTNQDVTLNSGNYESNAYKSHTSTFKVKGSVDAHQNQFSGKYSGALVVRVKHNGWIK